MALLSLIDFALCAPQPKICEVKEGGNSSSGSDDADDEKSDANDDETCKAVDESFTSAINRFKEMGCENLSPSSRGKADGEFKRLLRSNNRYVVKVCADSEASAPTRMHIQWMLSLFRI